MNEQRVQRLSEFKRWVTANITGDEKGQAQIFLDRFFQALGHKGCLDVGGTAEFRVRKGQSGAIAFADYVWKPFVLIEMKKRGTDLQRHYRQAFDYWVELVPGRPRYVILCNFDEFWIYDFETQMDTPVDKVSTADLPARYDPFAFLFPVPERPVFGNDQEQVTREAADKLAACFNKLIDRNIPRDLAQRFALQLLVALFAEDIGLLDRNLVARLLAECKKPTDTYDLLGGLFEAMNNKDRARGGRFKDVEYFNGGLFAQPARIELQDEEISLVRLAAKSDWSKVRPEIFGTLFEHSLEKRERHAYGGHYTHPTDIMKIVGPTIVHPWRELIENARTITELERLHARMQRYRVLDPACGSGNFLYIAYRELKRLEARLFERLAEIGSRQKGQRRIGFVTAAQFYGMDINPFAVEIAKVTMMIARKFAIDELHAEERALPLDNLDSNFFAGDALITPLKNGGVPLQTMLFSDLEEDPWKAKRFIATPWPNADVIIGNPPFLGSKRLKPERGADYVNAVRKVFPDVPGMADYCVYWFRLTNDRLPSCAPEDRVAGRAGLVGTQNIRNNQSRVGGLDHIVENGTIIEAVDNQPWSGEANVHVSIVNWVKTQNKRLLPRSHRLWYKVDPPRERAQIKKQGDLPLAKEYELRVRECNYINSALSDEPDIRKKRSLACNKRPKRCFQGKIPGFDGFLLSEAQARRMARDSAKVVVPYLTGRELLSDFRISRWAIDFQNLDIYSAAKFKSAFRHCESEVLPEVEATYRSAMKTGSDMATARKEHLNRWWQFWNRRDELNKALDSMNRVTACSRVTRRPIMVFISTTICPSDLIQVFAFDDDYSFGILQGFPHFQWFRKSSRLKVETDIRYSLRDVFETYPWPQRPSSKQVREVASAAVQLHRVRAFAMEKATGGLRALYRALELPGKNPLRDAHAALDETVMAAYGFSTAKDILTQLLALNYSVARAIERGENVTAPGIPHNYPNPKELVTKDCIEP